MALTPARAVEIPNSTPFFCAAAIVCLVKSEIDLSLWNKVPSKSERIKDMFSILNYEKFLEFVQVFY